MGLEQYHQKRDFSKTSEPKGKIHRRNKHRFTIQKHAASHLHYDFRIELDGVLKSWSIPKGPCLDPDVKRLAVQTEDHPVEYCQFEGIIPKKEYGGGSMIVWDFGTWEPLDEKPLESFKKGHLRFIVHSQKLGGRWDLFKIKNKEGEKGAWFLKKYDDDFAVPLSEYDITEKLPHSIVSGKTVEQISSDNLVYKVPKLDLPQSSFPKTLSPQLATLTDKAPEGDEWLHEVKFDGYRMLAFKQGDVVQIISRNNKNWTHEFQSIADEVKKLPVNKLILDGEIVVIEKDKTSFQRLQNSIEFGVKAQFFYYVFDLVYLGKWDIRELPLIERKNLLKPLITPLTPKLLYSDHLIGNGEEVYKTSCELSLEGIISKRIDSVYLTKRSKSWLKVKCVKRQEFVIAGFTPPQGARSYFGSLYLGTFNEQGELVYSGNVGTGFTQNSLKTLHEALEKRIIDVNPLSSNPPGIKTATWVKPELICEVEFTEWTDEGNLRHPSFKGLRSDKKANEVTREKTLPIEVAAHLKPSDKTNKKASVVLTSPHKVLYPEDKITKEDLYRYYEEVCEWMLPYIKDRPVTLVRCPKSYGQCFYQKHFNKSSAKTLNPVPIEDRKDHHMEQYMSVSDRAGLLGLVQMGVLEIHPWGSTIHHLDQPDVLVFDLDPAPDVPWEQVVDSALMVKDYLEQINLTSFVKTTGGKGLHVVVPIKPEQDWDAVKEFTHAFVETLETMHPKLFVSNMAKAKRKGKIFLDYLRNQWDATAIGPYSTRARLHAPVATPVHWDELSTNIEDTSFNIFTLPKRLKHLSSDPWKNFWILKQSLNLEQDS